MEYVVTINEHTLEVLKSIVSQIENSQIIATPVTKHKKLSKTEQAIKNMRELRARKTKRNL